MIVLRKPCTGRLQTALRPGGCYGLAGTSTFAFFESGFILRKLDVTFSGTSQRNLSLSAALKKNETSEYDVVVIGGGSGGLACAKEASDAGGKVCVLDYVEPSVHNTKWGLGGTCVNVGCIPKKLMHQASIVGKTLKEGSAYGWQTGDQKFRHDWSAMRDAVQMHIKSLNWGHRVQLKSKNVTYMNAWGSFQDENTVKATQKNGKETLLRSKNFVLAMGLRPRYPNIPGSELGISSDDLFSLSQSPGKTLVVGASYVALECAGFLRGLGHEDVSVAMRSIPLRGFDQEMAELIVGNMEREGVHFHRGAVPSKITRNNGGKLMVSWDKGEPEPSVVDTVLWAIGREPKMDSVNLSKGNVKVDDGSRRVLVNERDQSSVQHIFAIGDIAHGRPELTPSAIMAGKLLARRLMNKSDMLMDYANIATTVFTPLEYGCVGLSEEDAEAQFGKDNVSVYHAFYKPLEFYLPDRNADECYLKIVCLPKENNRLVGLHFLGPNAGEVTQGFGCLLRTGSSATLDLIQSTVGIHPTCAEEIVKVHVRKGSGEDPKVSGC